MANFCTKCGRPLNEGEVCSCQTTTNASVQVTPQMTTPQAAPQMTPPPQAAPQMTPPPQAAPQMTPPPQAAPQMTPPPQATPQMTPPPQAAPQMTPPPQAAPQMTPPPQATPQGNYQQAAQGMVPPPVAPNPGAAPTRTKEAEWFNQTKDAFVSNTKNIFQELLPMLKTPSDTATRLSKGDNGLVLGLELIAVKTVLALIMFVIAFIRLHSTMGGYISLPWFRGIFLVLFATVGADCLNAVALKVVSGLFNRKATIPGMFAIVGQRVLFDVGIMVVMGVTSLFSTGIATAVVIIGSMGLIAMEYDCFVASTEGEKNKNVYVYMIAKAAVTVIILLIVSLLLKGMLSSLIGGSLFGGLGSLLGGAGGSGMMNYLY